MRNAPDHAELAPRWHTALLVGLMLSVAGTGIFLTWRGGNVPAAVPVAVARGSLFAVYAPMIFVQSCLLLYVCRIGRPRNALGSLLGKGWRQPSRAAIDVVLAALTWLVIVLCELAWRRMSVTGQGATTVAMLPHTPSEKLGWVVVALVVGVSEEVVYRGYLQKQLSAFTGSAIVGVIAQALLFGLAHANQGAAAVVRITLYGLLFGVLARIRGSLVPGIVCHVWTDVASGLFG